MLIQYFSFLFLKIFCFICISVLLWKSSQDGLAKREAWVIGGEIKNSEFARVACSVVKPLDQDLRDEKTIVTPRVTGVTVMRNRSAVPWWP